MFRGLYWFSCHSFHSFYFIRQKENGSYVNTRHKRQINTVHYIKWYKALFLDNQTAYFVGDIALRHQPAAGWPPVSTRHSPGYTHAQAICTKCSPSPQYHAFYYNRYFTSDNLSFCFIAVLKSPRCG
jgi:hypothetical protein